jgi:hypothetical protein
MAHALVGPVITALLYGSLVFDFDHYGIHLSAAIISRWLLGFRGNWIRPVLGLGVAQSMG